MPPVYPKILIIEDELIIAADVSVQLSKLGYEVMGIHARAADAIKTMATNRPDIVVLDISLSGKVDGLTAARMITKSYQLPIVFLSANTDRESLRHAIALQPYAFITKPFASEDLQNVMYDILIPTL
jgi:CheY-like chemotaxis protein